jgi:hypothetical protein
MSEGARRPLTGSPPGADDRPPMVSGGARHELGAVRCEGRWRELEDVAASYAAAVVTAAEKPKLVDQTPTTTPPRWVKPLSCYERRETTIVEGLRYG